MSSPRILILGAHPDDADIKAGGCASKWRRLGCEVRLVSVTDGRAGHHLHHGPDLAGRRRAEARAAGAVIGATYDVLDHHDGELLPTLAARWELIRLIRGFHPDLILTHRPNDYHPDHRYTSRAKARTPPTWSRVPAVFCKSRTCNATRSSSISPTTFRSRPVPAPDRRRDVDDELGRMVDMLHCHVSQFYEWLPYNGGYAADVPADDAARRSWLDERIRRRLRPLADRFRDLVVRTYGEEHGRRVEYVEAFEASEYGAPFDAAARARLFPFVPGNA